MKKTVTNYLNYTVAALATALLTTQAAHSQNVKVVTDLTELEGTKAGVRYYDRWASPLTSATGAYSYDVIRPVKDSLGIRWRVRRYSIKGHHLLLDMGFSSELPWQTPHGQGREWFANGKLREDVSYRNGKVDGVLKTYFDSGQLRRSELHKNGKLVDQECFNGMGMPVDCSAYHTFAHIQDGALTIDPMKLMQRQFQQFLPKGYTRATDGAVYLTFRVDSVGQVQNVRVLDSDDPVLSAAALEAARRLPDFVPAVLEGSRTHDVFNGHLFYYAGGRTTKKQEDE